MGKIILFTILRVVAFVVLMMVLGRKLIPKALMMVANTGSRELFTLFLLACSIGIAFGAAAVFEVSFALGAFFAGMVMRESKYAHRAATESLPLQDAFAVLFFVGVGMMLDWHVLFEQPISVLCVLAIIMLGKSVTAFALVHCLKYPLHTSLIVGASLAQIGEFSFILAAQGIALKLMDEQIMSMIVAAAILSIALNPVMFALIPPLRRYLLRWFRWARTAAMRTDPFSVLPKETERRVLMGQAIIVGTGTVCGKIRDKFVESQMPFVSVVEDQTQAAQMRERKLAVITGDASDPMVLVQSHIVTAKMLLIIGLDQIKAKKVVEVARQLNPNIRILVRMRSRIEMQHWGETQDIEFLYDRDMISESMFKSIQAHYQPADAAH
jgi:CPA2 family monovalent cation:H+ antiporter-2